MGNSLLVERVLSQWIYVIKGKADFKGSAVEDGPIADGAPGRIRLMLHGEEKNPDDQQ